MYSLRDYQADLINSVYTIWNERNARIILQLPTGAGKTIIFAQIINKFIQQNKRVLVIAHRRELIAQAHGKIRNITGVTSGIIQSGFKQNLNCIVQVASIQTLINIKDSLDVDLLIFDEAHHTASQSYLKILNQYSQALVLGVTATPVRTDGRGFKDIYEQLIVGPSVSELIEQGCLSNFKMFGAVAKIKTKGIKITAGDFNSKELSQAVAAADITGDLVPTWKKYAEGKKTVLFAIDVSHSKECTKAFLDAGIPAEHIDGTTPATERDATLNRFRRGETLVLCNCNIVTEGFDVPTIEAIQCVRPTLSLVLYLQMFGRSLRPSPEKEYAILIDHTNNWGIHGLPDTPQDWSLEPKPSKPGAFTQKCPKCGHIFQPSSHEVKQIIGYSQYNTIVLSTHYTTCPHCYTKFKFFLGIDKKSRSKQLTLDILEEYGQIIEITSEQKSIQDVLQEQDQIARVLRVKYGRVISPKIIILDSVLGIKSTLFVYGNRVDSYDSPMIGLVQNCYTGVAILTISLDKADTSRFDLFFAEITLKEVIVNHAVLAILSIIEIDEIKQNLILNKIEKIFCFQLQIRKGESKATKETKKAEDSRQRAIVYRKEINKQQDEEKQNSINRKSEEKHKPQILRIKPKKEV